MKWFLLLLFSLSAFSQSGPIIWGPGRAKNLTDILEYKNGVQNLTGSLDPSSTAVSAPASSMYHSTSGTIYVKQDSGLSTNWLPLGVAAPSSLSTLNGQSGPAVSIASGSAGTDFAISASGNVITLDIPTASGTNRGLLSSANWTTFNGKEPAITATTSADYFRGDKTFQPLNKAAVGLASVDDTSDADKPISDDTQDALDLKADQTDVDLKAPIASPTFTGTVSGITKAMVGLGNADNTSDANKPVSTATQTALNLKQDAATAATDAELTAGLALKEDAITLLPLSKGGTNKNITAGGGKVLFTDADSVEQTAAGTSGQVLTSAGTGTPTWSDKSLQVKAQEVLAQTVKELQVPNQLLTTIDGTNAKFLHETGNNNILSNPSFESYVVAGDWNWTTSPTAETSVVVHGKKSIKVSLTASAFQLDQESGLYYSQFADGVQGLASIRVKTSVSGFKFCTSNAGVISTTNCINIVANGKWGLYKIPVILGDTANGVALHTNSVAVTGDVYVDDAFLGAVDLKASGDSSRVAGEAYFAGTTSCSWARATTSIGAFTSTAACPGPTIAYSSVGSWQTTDSDLPRVTVNNLPAGTYKAKFLVRTTVSTSGNGSLAINDGTTTCEPLYATTGGSQYTAVVVECSFTYNSAGNRVFELYGAASANQINISNDLSSPRTSTKFILEYFSSSSTYTSTNADTDWAACNFSTLVWSGYGTVTNNNLKCKRHGSDLLIDGTFVTGTSAVAPAQIPMPLWNGSQLVIASSTKVASTQVAGRIIRNLVSSVNDYTALISPGNTYIGGSILDSATVAPLTYQNANALVGNSETVAVKARIPIAGWENSNIIIGQFDGLESCISTLACTDTFSAKVSSAGVVSAENVDWINGNFSVSATSTYTGTFNTSIFTVAPNCVFIANGGANINFFHNVATTTTTVVPRSQNASNTDTAQGFDIICTKQGSDYVGKTARAVASDQNNRTPGILKMAYYSSTFAGASTATACGSTPCTKYDETDAAFGSSMTRSSTGTYALTSANNAFAPNVKVRCDIQLYNSAVSWRINSGTFTSNSSGAISSVAIQTYNTSGTLADAVMDVTCWGATL